MKRFETRFAGFLRARIIAFARPRTELSSRTSYGHPIDLIILDVGLPWINGYELAEMMKAHKDLKRIPLIFISGRVNDADVKRGFEVGADDYIKKPFDLEKIKKTVRTLVQLNKTT